MPKMNREKFVDFKPPPGRGGGGSGIFCDVKKTGSAKGWINTHASYYTRDRHGMIFFEVKPGEKGTKSYNCVMETDEDGNVSGRCPLCALGTWANIQIKDGIAEIQADARFKDEKARTAAVKELKRRIILSGKSGSDGEFSLGNLAGVEGDFRKTGLTSVRTELVVAWVPIPSERGDKFPVQILSGPMSLLTSIQKLIKTETDSDTPNGYGDPMESPWPMRIAYDKNAKKSEDYWSVAKINAEKYPLDSESETLVTGDPMDHKIDLDKHVAPAIESDVLDSIEQAWVSEEYSFEDFERWYKDTDGGKEGKPEPKAGNKTAPKATSKPKDSTKGKTNSMNCPHCKEVIPAGSKSCECCGEDIPQGDKKAEPKKASGIMTCPHCGEEMKPTKAGRCPLCVKLVNDEPSVSDDDVPF